MNQYSRGAILCDLSRKKLKVADETLESDHSYAPSLSSESTVSPQKSLHRKRSSKNIKKLSISRSNCSPNKIKTVTVQSSRNNDFKYRKNYYPFCLKLYSHLPRHMTNKHKVEMKVQNFLSHPKKSKERATLLEELRKLGNFRHNVYAIKNKEGQILPAFRPKEDKSAETYVLCKNCLGFYPKSLLWRHNAKCKKNHKPHLQGKRIVGHGMNLLLSNATCSEQFLDKVVGPMNTDDVNLAIRNDTLILKFGESMFLKNPEPWKFRYARDAMRGIGKLLINLRKVDSSISSLRDAIHPKRFQSIVLAAKNIAGFDGVNTFDHASVVLKIGINMKKCAEILSGIYLDEDNEESSLACEQFIKRHDREWANSISSLALKDLHQKKFNKPKYLPIVEDFQKLSLYITKNTKEVLSKLSSHVKKLHDLKENKQEIRSLWMRLMNLTLSSIILFNRKRSGEAERIMIRHYREGIKSSPSCPDLQKTLSNSEQLLSNYFHRIEIPGKRGNKVPVILSKLHIESIEMILKFRSVIGVSSENNFLFARPYCHSINAISGCKALKDIVNEAKLQKPDTMMSTTLRKHIATMSQVLNLKQPELEELCKVMGHDIRIHTSYYRLPDDAVQLGKLTKLLIAAQNGQILKYRNKTLEDIELDEDGKINVRRPLNAEEKALALKYFRDFLQKQKLPGKEECMKFLTEHVHMYVGKN